MNRSFALVGVAAFGILQVVVAGVVIRGHGPSAAVGRSESAAQETPGASGLPVQDPENPCGPVCIALVSHLLERPIALHKISECVSPDALGRTSMAELMEALRKLGFGAAGVALEPEACRVIDAPLIIHQRGGHFAAVITTMSDTVVVLDPPTEPTRRSIESLSRDWDGRCIVVGEDAAEVATLLASLGIESDSR